jgi:predicted aspartyl protease
LQFVDDDTKKETNAMEKMLWLAVVAIAIVPAPAADIQPTFAQLLEHADKADLAPLRRAELSSYSVPERLLLQARMAVSKGDTASARKLLDHYEQSGDRAPVRLREAAARRQDIEMLAANYAAAARHGEAWERVPGAAEDPGFADHRQTTVIARQLKDVRPVQVRGSIKQQTTPTTKDKIGLTRMVISIGGLDQDAVIDTGASFSVVSASAARRLGLQLLEGAATVGSTTSDSVDTRLAVAHRAVIAGTEFSSVVFLVMNDDQLEFPVPGGYKIDAILGFPELSRLGRLNFGDHVLEVAPSSKADPSRGNLVLVDNKLFVATDLGGVCVPLYLDTGANASSLSALFVRDHPDVTRSLPTVQVTLGGAGGTQVAEMLDWQKVPVTLGRHRVVLPSLQIHQKDPVENLKQYGTLGRDVLEHGYSLDFPAMNLELHGDLVASAPGCD